MKVDLTFLKKLEKTKTEEDPSLNSIVQRAREEHVPIVSSSVATILKVLLTVSQPRNVCELGMGYGYSTLSMASRLPEKSELHSVDASIHSVQFVEKELQKRSYPGVIHLYHETAISFLDRMKKNNQRFDFFFVDAVKKEYITYLEKILDISNENAVLVFDNVLWRGEVMKDVPSSGKAKTLKAFNHIFLSNQKVSGTILPLGDGLAIGIVHP